MKTKIGKNQYLFANHDVDEAVDGYESKISINGHFLYLGKGCRYFCAGNGIHVLGYAVDVNRPSYTLQEMCDELWENLNDGAVGPEATRSWNGRWIILAEVDHDFLAWNDCCGLKQLFWDTKHKYIFASQARYISTLYGYDKEPGAVDYLEKAKSLDKEYSMLLDRTLYKDVRRLLPNTYLKNNKSIRSDFTKEKGSSEVAAQLIRNAMLGIKQLGPLAVTLTAGWDSRLVLAGIGNSTDITAVTLKYDWMSYDNQDIIIASKLAEKVDLPHKIIDCGNESEDFYDEYMLHSEIGHDYWVQMSYAVLKGDLQDCYWVKGSCNEIVRNSFGVLYDWQVNAKILCKLYSLPITDFALEVIDNWIKNSKTFCRTNKISLLDLFYWEHRMGNWLAECLNEADIVGETYTPFNSRAYIENGLTVPTLKRGSPKYLFFRDIILENDIYGISRIPINGGRYDSFSAKMKSIIKNRIPLLYGLLIMLKV